MNFPGAASTVAQSRGRRARRRRAALAVTASALTLVMAGCGSTALRTVGAESVLVDANGVPVDASGLPVDASGVPVDASGTPIDSGLGAPNVASGPATGAPTTGSAGPGAVTPTGGSKAQPNGSSAPSPSAPGSNITAPLKVGVVATDVGAIGAVFGASTEGYDLFKVSKAFIAYINKHGGAGGRQIQPVFYTADSGSDANTNGQRACQAFTQDQKVDLVVSVGLLGEVLPACLKAAGIAMFDSANWFADRVSAQQFPNWIMPSAARLDRSAASQLQQAASRGVLKQGDKLGVLVESCPWGPRTLESTVRPIADRLGIPVVTGSIKCIANIVADLGPVSNDVQRETLRFSQEGVTDVLILSVAEAFVLARFTENASNQRYAPWYLATSNAYLYNNSGGDGGAVAISQDALPRIFGTGTLPLLDVGPGAMNVSGSAAQARARCKEAEPTLGAPNGRYDEGNRGKYFSYTMFYSQCEAFFTMAAVLKITHGRTGYPDVANGFRTFLSQGVGSSALAGGRYAGSTGERTDGASYVQNVVYSTSKQTFVFDGPVGRLQ